MEKMEVLDAAKVILDAFGKVSYMNTEKRGVKMPAVAERHYAQNPFRIVGLGCLGNEDETTKDMVAIWHNGDLVFNTITDRDAVWCRVKTDTITDGTFLDWLLPDERADYDDIKLVEVNKSGAWEQELSELKVSAVEEKAAKEKERQQRALEQKAWREDFEYLNTKCAGFLSVCFGERYYEDDKVRMTLNNTKGRTGVVIDLKRYTTKMDKIFRRPVYELVFDYANGVFVTNNPSLGINKEWIDHVKRIVE